MINPQSSQSANSNNNVGLILNAVGLIVNAIVIVLILFGLAYVIATAPTGTEGRAPEVQIGLIVLLSVGVMLSLLFVVALSFKHVGLSDNQQALGLPEGSIRALIALFLVMLFVLVSLFLFRTAATGDAAGVLQAQTAEQVNTLLVADRVSSFKAVANASPQTYDVTLKSKLTDDGVRFAQQILTTVGTLVVAVAGFYFGATSVQSAVNSQSGAAGAGSQATLTVKAITPPDGVAGQRIPSVQITGTGFADGTTAWLENAGTQLKFDQRVTVANATTLTASLTLDAAVSKGKWDVIVQNADANRTEARFAAGFEVK